MRLARIRLLLADDIGAGKADHYLLMTAGGVFVFRPPYFHGNPP